MNKTTLAIVGVLVLGVIGYFVVNNTKSPESQKPSPQAVMEKPTPRPSGSTGDTGADTDQVTGTTKSDVVELGAVKEFTLEGTSFAFSKKELKVKKGDTVKIIFNNKEGFHDWVIDEFSANTKKIGAGQSDTIQFVADKVGTFEYYCSVGSHRANGMKGNLIVT